MLEYVSIATSSLALVVAGTTLYLSHLKKGQLKISQPTQFFFGFDPPTSIEAQNLL